MPLNYLIVTTETIEPRTRAQVDETVVIASFFALLTGAIEVLVKSVRIFGLGRIIGVSPDYPWMTPLAYALFFVPAALVLATLFRLARRAWNRRPFLRSSRQPLPASRRSARLPPRPWCQKARLVCSPPGFHSRRWRNSRPSPT